jgi:hypothetical protein
MRQGLHVALSISLGAALGAGFFAALVRSTPPPPQDSGNHEALAKAIAELSASVRALDEKVGSLQIPAAPAPTSRAATEAPPGPPEDVARTMRDVVARLDLLQSAMASRSTAQPPLALQSARSPDLAVLEGLREKPYAERGREHEMLTFREVLDRYGRPDGVTVREYYGAPGIIWTYRLPGERLLRFTFVQGYAIWVNDERQPF